jgi:hypothetical protein
MLQQLCTNLKQCLNFLYDYKECKASKFTAVVAYVKESGIKELQNILGEEALKQSVIITGLDFYFTEPNALKYLDKIGTKVMIYSGKKEFHPKLYIIKCINGEEYLIVGSANISYGAIIDGNIESNLITDDKNVLDRAKELIKNIEHETKSLGNIIYKYEGERNKFLSNRSEIVSFYQKEAIAFNNEIEGLKSKMSNEAKLDDTTNLTEQIIIDTFEAYNSNKEIANSYITKLISELTKISKFKLPEYEEESIAYLRAKVYRPVENAHDKLFNSPIKDELSVCMHRSIGGKTKKKVKAYWEAIELLLIPYRYGIRITKDKEEKGLALAREYGGAFVSRGIKNSFARKLVECLSAKGFVTVGNNKVMPNLKKFEELGLYYADYGKLELIIKNSKNVAYEVRLILLMPFTLKSETYKINKYDILNLISNI